MSVESGGPVSLRPGAGVLAGGERVRGGGQRLRLRLVRRQLSAPLPCSERVSPPWDPSGSRPTTPRP